MNCGQQLLKKAKDSGVVMQIWTDQNPQGFSYRQFGERDRRFIDLDGLALVEYIRALIYLPPIFLTLQPLSQAWASAVSCEIVEYSPRMWG